MAGTEVVQRRYELNCLPMVLGEDWDTGSLLELDADNVVLAALKWSEDNRAWVLRLYETHGKAVEAIVKLKQDIESLHACDLLEREIKTLKFSGEQFTCPFTPFEIQTYRLSVYK